MCVCVHHINRSGPNLIIIHLKKQIKRGRLPIQSVVCRTGGKRETKRSRPGVQTAKPNAKTIPSESEIGNIQSSGKPPKIKQKQKQKSKLDERVNNLLPYMFDFFALIDWLIELSHNNKPISKIIQPVVTNIICRTEFWRSFLFQALYVLCHGNVLQVFSRVTQKRYRDVSPPVRTAVLEGLCSIMLALPEVYVEVNEIVMLHNIWLVVKRGSCTGAVSYTHLTLPTIA